MLDELQQLGLSRSAAEVFDALLSQAPCFVAPLVRTTRKHRQIVYNALDELQKKGFVIVSKRNGKNYYTVDTSGHFVSKVEHALTLARGIERQIAKKVIQESEDVQVFSGKTSYEHGLADFRKRAEESGEYVVIGGEAAEWYEHVQPFFGSHVQDLRRLKRRGVTISILFFEPERRSAETHIGPYLNDPYRCRVSASSNPLPHTAWLSGEYVYLLTPATDPLVVRIKSFALSRQYRHYYSSEWKRAESL
jgi:sugar-specific transcriptional regulator TrmB